MADERNENQQPVQPFGDAQPAADPAVQPTQPVADSAVQPTQPAQPASDAQTTQFGAADDAAAANPYGAPPAQPAANPYAQPVQPEANPYAQAQQTAQPYAADQFGGGQQPPYGGQPPYGEQPPYQQPQKSTNGKAIAALILGIVAIVFSWTIILGIGCGIAALILGILATKQGKDGKATGGKICGIIGMVLSVIMLVVGIVVGVSVVNFIQNNPELGTYTETEDGFEYSFSIDGATDEDAVEAVMTPRMDELCNMDSTQLEWLAGELSSEFAETGLTLESMGIDPMELATWLTTDMSYSYDSIEVNGDTATAYMTVTTRDLQTLVQDFVDDATVYLDEAAVSGATQEEAYAQCGNIFRTCMNEQTGTFDSEMWVDLTKVGDEWEIDEDSWDNEVDYVFWLNLDDYEYGSY